MSGNSKTKMIYRCPVCFNTTVDIPLINEEDNFRCLKCSFTGTKNDVIEMYNDFKKRYRLMDSRITLEQQIKM
jgi:DNA-directed RNA polymerase subunit RPC12/RpoP